MPTLCISNLAAFRSGERFVPCIVLFCGVKGKTRIFPYSNAHTLWPLQGVTTALAGASNRQASTSDRIVLFPRNISVDHKVRG